MTVTIRHGDCREVLRTMAEESVHCCVTSPPYFGLRDYGVAGQIGLEPTPEAFVAEMVAVFREVRRVLRPDGTLWLNLGDSYARSVAKGGSGRGGKEEAYLGDAYTRAVVTGIPEGLKPKDLIGIPWMVAFALRADGWYLRQDIIWHKPNPMPESVEDRCTKAHEYVFLMSKSERYHYDFEAIMEPSSAESVARAARGRSADHKWADGGPGNQTIAKKPPSAGRASGNKSHKHTAEYEANGDERHRTKAGLLEIGETVYAMRNKRSVWTVASEPFSEAHFATFPPALIEPAIKAGCPEGGTVLDPFGGAGTTGMVADRLGREAILIELNPEYAAIAERRIRGDAGMFAQVAAE